MTSYDREETFGLYLAVLKKGEPSPLLPESDEDQGVGSAPPGGGGGRGGRGGGPGGAQAEGGATDDQAPQTPRAPRVPVTVQIDFDGLPQRILSIESIPVRQYSQLKAGAPGTVFYLEAGGAAGGGGGRGGAGGGGSTLQRYRLSDRRAATFVTGVAEYSVSADGRKLLYRTGGGGGGRGGRGGGAAGGAAVNLFLVDADRNAPQTGQGRLDVSLRMYLDPREEFKQIFNEGWRNQRDYLYVPEPARQRLAEDEGDVRTAPAIREPSRRSELPARQHGRRDCDRSLVRARRRHAGRSAVSGRVARC